MEQKKKTYQTLTPNEKDEVFETIITELIEGKPIAKILPPSREGFPSAFHFFNFIVKDPTKQRIYQYAREVLAHKLFDDLLTISKGEGSEDTITKVQRDRLQADVIKWYISKVLPKIYGEKLDVTTNGESVNVISLGVGITPTSNKQIETNNEYIDVTVEDERGDSNDVKRIQ